MDRVHERRCRISHVEYEHRLACVSAGTAFGVRDHLGKMEQSPTEHVDGFISRHQFHIDACLAGRSMVSTHEKYGLNQSDFYQLFAYGQRYLPNGGGLMLLIYPMTHRFR